MEKVDLLHEYTLKAEEEKEYHTEHGKSVLNRLIRQIREDGS